MLKKLSIPVLITFIVLFFIETMGLLSCSKAAIEPVLKTDTIIKAAVDSGLTIYSAPAGTLKNNDYTVQVRNEGGTWHEIFEYNAVNMNKGPFTGTVTTPINNQTFAYFDSSFKTRIEVKVTMNNRASINSVRIRPTSYGIAYTESGYSISFFLDQPRNVSVEFNDDIYHNLFLYANAPEVNPPKDGDAGVIYYGPGLHNAGNITLGTGQTIYLAGGAVVNGIISGNNITNSTIRGHGILQNGRILINNSNHITIEGIIIINSPGWTIVPSQVDSSLIQNVKIINQGVSTDGTDASGCNGLTFDNIFYRIPDDCISIKCNNVTRPNKNIIIKNSTFWSDAAHCILFGPEGNGTSTSGVEITNCDFLECKYPTSDFWGVIGITNGGSQTIRDITIEDSRVEDISCSNLVSFRIEADQWSPTPGGPIKNIVFRNITFNGSNANANYIKGYDDTRSVDSVTFDNLQINGQHIMSALQGNFTIGPFATNVIFK
jgi:polygalacturonase